MKTNNNPLRLTAVSLLAAVGFLGTAQANLLSNGSFESNPIGTSASYGTGGAIDSTTFTDWRFFTVGSPAIDLFQGRIVDAADFGAGGTPGSHAFRFDVVNTGTPVGSDYALDRDGSKVPVSFGTTYTLSFDAVLYGVTGPGFSLNVGLAEFDGANSFTGSQTGLAPALPGDALFHNYSYSWTPLNPATTQINIAFRPTTPGYINAVGLDNIEINAVPEPGTMALGLMSGLVLFTLRRSRRA